MFLLGKPSSNHDDKSAPFQSQSHRKIGMNMCPCVQSGDEDSRDSGVADLDERMDELEPARHVSNDSTLLHMDFSLSYAETTCAKLDLDKLMLDESCLPLAARRNARKPLSDLNPNSKEIEVDSPKSRRPFFSKPQPLQRHATVANATSFRKRSAQESRGASKRIKFDLLGEDIAEDIMDMPSCSTAVPAAVLPHPARTRISLTRTHSMPAFDRQEQENIEPPIVDIEPNWHLPLVGGLDSTAFRRISASTLYGLLSSLTDEEFNRKYMLIDCRYPFEYEGGHIRNAINLFDTTLCEEFFYPASAEQQVEFRSKIPIFYCEFSQHRGPQMANTLRSRDRFRNLHNYPKVDFVEMYVLDKGYRNFYQFTNDRNITSVCEPHQYVKMCDYRFTEDLKKFHFHKSTSFGGTSMKKANANSRLRAFGRQLSESGMSSPSSPSSSSGSRPTPRRNLFSLLDQQLSPLAQSPSPTSSSFQQFS